MNDDALKRGNEIKARKKIIKEELGTITKALGEEDRYKHYSAMYKPGDDIEIAISLDRWSPSLHLKKSELDMVLNIKRGLLNTELEKLNKEYDAL